MCRWRPVARRSCLFCGEVCFQEPVEEIRGGTLSPYPPRSGRIVHQGVPEAFMGPHDRFLTSSSPACPRVAASAIRGIRQGLENPVELILRPPGQPTGRRDRQRPLDQRPLSIRHVKACHTRVLPAPPSTSSAHVADDVLSSFFVLATGSTYSPARRAKCKGRGRASGG